MAKFTRVLVTYVKVTEKFTIGNGIVHSEIFNSEEKSDLKHWTTVLDGQFRFPCCQFWTVYPQTLVFYNLLQYVPSETQEQQ